MDYFEATIVRILVQQGHWIRENVRIALTKEVKRALGNPSMPRCEIDIAAFCLAENELVLFEVKSYPDSFGVKPDDLRRRHAAGHVQDRFDKEVRAIVPGEELGLPRSRRDRPRDLEVRRSRYENSPFALTAKLLKRHLPA